nr:DUF1127 domain-containing protein [Anianabacter salinae]
MDATAGIGGAISTSVTRFFTRLSDWNAARITRRALSKLSDHELDDIGLARGDLDSFNRF